MLKKYGFMDSEEKPELTVKFMKYACQALLWAQRDEEVKREIYHEGKYLNEFSVGLATSNGALIDPQEPIKVISYLNRLMNQIELNVAYEEARKRFLDLRGERLERLKQETGRFKF